MKKSYSAKILFEMLAKCFEKQEIKAIHYIVDGARGVVTYREDGCDYQITVKPIPKPHAEIDPDDFFKSEGKVIPLVAVNAKEGN